MRQPHSALLGTNDDPVRMGLYACQPLKEFLHHVELDSRRGVFRALAATANLIDTGNPAEAINRLYGILKIRDLETRTILWVWTFLRELGERPDAKLGLEVLGVVMETPAGDGHDTLAAYIDGTASYLHHSGGGIFWNVPDSQVKKLCQHFIECTLAASYDAMPRADLTLPWAGAQITLLTRSGIYAFRHPSALISRTATELVTELTKRQKLRPEGRYYAL